MSPTRRLGLLRLTALVCALAACVALIALVIGPSGRPSRRRVATTALGDQGPRLTRTGQRSASSPSQQEDSHPRRDVALLSRSDLRSFQRFERTLPGRIGIALAPVDSSRVTTLGDDAEAHGWSTTKVPVIVALINKLGGRTHLSAPEQAEAEAAITESDNASILDLFSDLETLSGGLVPASDAIQTLLRKSGDDVTTVTTAPPPPGAVTTFGQTEWSPSRSVLFFRALAGGCLMQRTDTRWVLRLMEHIIPSESWGLGSAGFSSIAFKGGWGPEPTGAYLVRQSGIIDSGRPTAVAVAIVAHPPAGADSFTVGTQMLTETAVWLRRHVWLPGTADGRASCSPR